MPGLIETLVTKVEEFELPKASTVCALVILSYFLVTAGIAYDIINEPPAIGAVQDEATGKVKPVTFMPYRMNGQYIIEGISGAMMYTIGGLSLIALDRCQNKRTDFKLRLILASLGAGGLAMAYSAVMAFLRIKMPGYLRY
eukprot:GHRQ01003595.1.p2 GENE.GHRQ01003595.1~~GHRQ01003595.1.p2  ORF type:complete len:141 (+),score=44.25 GHRQ01003595.1:231-653(+)